MTLRTSSRLLVTLVAAALAGGIVSALSWGPMPPAGGLTSSAFAFHEDMSPAYAPDPDAATPPGPTTATELPDVATQLPDVAQTRARDREPAELSIPELGIEAEVLRTWMDGSASLVVPEDVLVTGWFDGSRRLDASYGSTVIVGHRDSAVQGTGALYAIEELPVGAAITVTDRSGTPHEFVVDSVEFIDKDSLPQEAPRIFTHRGPYRLVLITCGGVFDESIRSYESNVVITALPAPAVSD